MKLKKIKFFVLVILLGVAIAFFIPNFKINAFGKELQIKGLDEYVENKTLGKFGLKQSLDYNEFTTYYFDLDLSTYQGGDLDAKVEEIKNIIYTRFERAGLGDYSISAIKTPDKYQIAISVSPNYSAGEVNTLVIPGNVGFWVTDYSFFMQTDSEVPVVDNNEGTLMEKRKLSDLTNADIADVRVISDSRLFISSEVAGQFSNKNALVEKTDKISNFGVDIVFKKESQIKFLTAISANMYSLTPVVMSIDGMPVGLQATGQTFSYYEQPTSLMMVTLGEDQHNINKIIAAIISLPPIEIPLYMEQLEQNEPLIGANPIITASLTFMGLFIATQLLFVKKFKQASKTVIVLNGIAVVLSLTLMKLYSLFNVQLSSGLVLGLMFGYLIVFINNFYFAENILTNLKNGLTSGEVDSLIDALKNDFQKLVILIFIVLVIINSLPYTPVSDFCLGAGFGVAGGLFMVWTSAKIVINFFMNYTNEK